MSLARRRRALARPPFRTVGPREAAVLLEEGAVIVDVRERSEWEGGHAPQARHIPLGRIASSLGGLPSDRIIVTVCRSGVRSGQAAAVLARHGHDVANLAGGMNAWARAGLPVVGGRRRSG